MKNLDFSCGCPGFTGLESVTVLVYPLMVENGIFFVRMFGMEIKNLKYIKKWFYEF